MSEFKQRMAMQREIVILVNSRKWSGEQLHGLSLNAIDRWVLDNKQQVSSQLEILLKTTSDKLLFLANKSQDQVSDAYQIVVAEIRSGIDSIKEVLNEANM